MPPYNWIWGTEEILYLFFILAKCKISWSFFKKIKNNGKYIYEVFAGPNIFYFFKIIDLSKAKKNPLKIVAPLSSDMMSHSTSYFLLKKSSHIVLNYAIYIIYQMSYSWCFSV